MDEAKGALVCIMSLVSGFRVFKCISGDQNSFTIFFSLWAFLLLPWSIADSFYTHDTDDDDL